MKRQINILMVVCVLSLSNSLFAQKIEISDEPEIVDVTQEPVYRDQPTGKAAAQKFFSKKSSGPAVSGADDHYMMFGLGAFVNSKSYKWGPKNPDDDPGEFNAGVTYRFGEWENSMDFMVRIEYQTYDVEASSDPKKLSFIPMIVFPDARSGFPIYIGAGLGLGVFMDQPDNESSLSLDYQFVLGARMLNAINSVGLFVETGLKNHVHLLSSGQFDGVFVTFGTVFVF